MYELLGEKSARKAIEQGYAVVPAQLMLTMSALLKS